MSKKMTLLFLLSILFFAACEKEIEFSEENPPLSLALVPCTVDTRLINPEPCPQPLDKVYRPVCGCNGQTYGSACHAERAGVPDYIKGVCP